VLTDVAEARRTQQRVGHRMGNDIGITVSIESTGTIETHTAQYQSARGIIGEAMYVETLPDADREAAHQRAPLDFK
jgi:hypothetical protein